MADLTVSASDPSFVPCLSPVEWTAQRRRGRLGPLSRILDIGGPWAGQRMGGDADVSGHGWFRTAVPHMGDLDLLVRLLLVVGSVIEEPR